MYSIDKKPSGKQNCIAILDSGEKVPCYYHQKKDVFIGRYGSNANKELQNVVKWQYAILPKRHSSDLLPNFVDWFTLHNGKYVFMQEYRRMSKENQERLFNEVQDIRAQIIFYLENITE